MINFPAIRTVDDLEAFEQSFAVSFDLMELRAAIFHISDAYRARAEAPGEEFLEFKEALSDLRSLRLDTGPAYRLAEAMRSASGSPPSCKVWAADLRAALEEIGQNRSEEAQGGYRPAGPCGGCRVAEGDAHLPGCPVMRRNLAQTVQVAQATHVEACPKGRDRRDIIR